METNLTTYKCEGCGIRKPDGTQLVEFSLSYPRVLPFTVCSPACIPAAEQQYRRQRLDGQILALVGN